MKLLVTGPTGFLGRYVVRAALERGHAVRALVRPAAKSIPVFWTDHPQLEIVRADLRAKNGHEDLVAGVDAVVHAAAAKTGDLYEQFAGTVIATENLLTTMAASDVRSLVLISSFSVYEYLKRRSWSLLNESSPLANKPFERDEYCQTKMIQERIALDAAREHGWRCVVLRPGVIYGPDNLWTARLGARAGARRWIRMGTFAPLPLTYVENCADAIVLAAEYDGHEEGLVLNVVDNQSPSQRAYMKKLKRSTTPRPGVVPIPWTLIRALARVAWLTNRLFFGGTAKVPGLLVPCRLHARCKPLRYTNKRITATLGWKPRYTWQEGLDRSMEGTQAT